MKFNRKRGITLLFILMVFSIQTLVQIKSIIENYQFADTTGKLIKELHDEIPTVLVSTITIGFE